MAGARNHREVTMSAVIASAPTASVSVDPGAALAAQRLAALGMSSVMAAGAPPARTNH